MKRLFFLILVMCIGMAVFAQEEQLLPTALTEELHDSTATLPSLGIQLVNEDIQSGSTSSYTEGIDRWFTVCSPCTGSKRLCFNIQGFDVDASDTLFIYDGPDINSPLIAKGNNVFSNLYRRRYFVSANNTSNCLTVRFKTNTDGRVGAGFSILMTCETPCEDVKPVIESKFYRTHNGVVYDSAYLAKVTDPATEDFYYSVNMCDGDGMILKGHGEYSHYTGYYDPSDETSLFTWQINTGDNVVGFQCD